MSIAYQSGPGYPVPLWTSTTGILQPSEPVHMWYGASYVLIILAFVNLLFTTLTFFSVANQLKGSDTGEFGAGV